MSELNYKENYTVVIVRAEDCNGISFISLSLQRTMPDKLVRHGLNNLTCVLRPLNWVYKFQKNLIILTADCY